MMAGFSSSWADLPQDSLQQVLRNLPIPDNLRLVSCLRTWWAYFKEQPVPSDVQLPWLLIHPLPNDEVTAKIAAFFDLSRMEIVRIPVPLPPFQDRICVGATGGWMVTITKRTLEAHLLNPVSGRQIVLPRFHHISVTELNEDLDFSHVKRNDDYLAGLLVENVDEFFRDSKAVVTWGNRNENGEVAFTVVILLFLRGCVVVSRGGQPEWQVLQPPRFYEDVIIDASCRFFLLDPIHRWVDIRSLQHQESQSSLGILSLHMPQERDLHFAYLAGWFVGEESEFFILVKKTRTEVRLNEELEVIETYFKVFKYYRNVYNFEEVHDLGGKSIFVGANNAIVSSLPGLRRNSIYYLDGFRHPNYICMYDMEEQSVQRIAIGADIPSPQRDAVWLTPSFE